MRHELSINMQPKTMENAASDSKEIFQASKEKFGFIPNMYLNMANSPSALAVYYMGYNQFRERSGFTPTEQEVIFLTLSKENECHYCTAAHSTIADKISKVPKSVIHAIRLGKVVEDPKLAVLSDFTRVMHLSRGNPTQQEIDNFISAGFKAEQMLDVVLAVAVKTISNYSNHLFQTSIDKAFSEYA
jgi:uncharacterized peroxidase-related enzyme